MSSAIKEEGQLEAFPADIAMETVVMTTTPRAYKRKSKRNSKRQTSDTVLEEYGVGEVTLALSEQEDESGLPLQEESLGWTQFETRSISVDGSDIPVPSILQGTDGCILETGEPVGVSLREASKRMRDKLKKRELRRDPKFRQEEGEKARARMAARRRNPLYRETERQRDRERRRVARQNQEVRDRERKRDKAYKHTQRLAQDSCVIETVCDGIDGSEVNLGNSAITVYAPVIYDTAIVQELPPLHHKGVAMAT